MNKIILFALAAIMFASCEKEGNISQSELSTNQFKFDKKTVFGNLNNTGDAEDHHINVSLYSAGEALKDELTKRPSAINSMFDAYRDRSEMKMTEVLADESNMLFTKLSKINSSMQYKGVQYYAVLSLMNNKASKEILRSQDNFIIAIAVEINDEDAIPGWKFTGNTVSEVTVLEKDLDGDTPIFIVQNSTDHVEMAQSNVEPTWTGGQASGEKTDGPISIDWDFYQIKDGYRYENNGKSELQFAATFYQADAPYIDVPWGIYMYDTYGLSNYSNAKIKSISKSDIQNSVIHHSNKPFIRNHPAALYDEDDAQYYITVFERDWAQSRKGVQSCFDLIHAVRMKYSGDWYYVDYCHFSAKNSVPGDNFTVSNAKCSLKLTRTN